VRDLRALGKVAAPETLHDAVLDRLGLGDRYVRIQTPLGPVFVAFNRIGVTEISRAGHPGVYESEFRERHGRYVRYSADIPRSIARAFDPQAEQHVAREVQIDLRGLSAFEQAVLHKAREIPRGEVRPYAWIAREIGHPGAVRAVGTALGHNPVPLLIPCHRVVRSDGHLGQYSMGGPEAKRAALSVEGVDPERLERLASSGVRFIGSDTTHIFCFPTCRHGRRLMDKHRVTFRSEREARAAGYRPCKVCRPAVA
jgi:O-6-methylguanine DNA methyltransferase